MVIIAFIINIILSLLIAKGASNRNRSGVGFFFLSFFFSFIIAGIILLVLGEKKTGTAGNTANPS